MCVIAALALGACAVPLDYPAPSEAALVVDGRKVHVASLLCAADGSVVATGATEVLSGMQGVALYSNDRGATWLRASIEGAAAGVPLSLLVLPADRNAGPLHMSGYRMGESAWSIAAKSSYQPGPWWTSADGGRSWRVAGALLPLPATTVMDASMPGIVKVDAVGTLLAAADRGDRLSLLRSTDHGTTWRSHTLPQLRHYGSMVSDGQGRVLLTGRSTRDDGVILRSNDSGASWAESRLASSTDFPLRLPGALRLYRSPAGAWIAYNNDHLGKGKGATWLFRSVDGGATWSFVRGLDRLGRIVGISANRKGRILAFTQWGHLLLSDDDGENWRQASPDVTVASEVATSHIVFADDATVFASLDRAAFVRSTDGGERWQAVASGLPDRQFVLGAHCTDGRGLIVLAGSGGMLTRSMDWGATWQRGHMR